ncbi:transglycosylase domain-containing protein [Natronosporangium hydrolyticum]|uniref:transglycosylase domain-containing protein n=1 Tax=Natronosporangium hydrolyticum TaxID=2811111 RepID=UPI001EFA1762|nr:transglycosylase domain-containing protein [Natronosporangium hydrolyticum]
MLGRIRSATGRATPLVRTALLAGVIVAAVLFPIAAIGGLAVKSGADLIDEVPTELTAVRPAQTTYVYASDGETLLTSFYEEHRAYVPITEMSPYIQQAIVAAEDTRFYEHDGVDPRGVARAFIANTQAGDVAQGGSTLTMQYVRMALRDGAETPTEVREATEQSATRKVREAQYAVEVEKELSKAEILERYLNHAYFGHRAYGIFAAAEIFFSKHPRDLTLVESAVLAGLVQAPSAYDPVTQDQQAAIERRNWVIDRMAELGYVAPRVAEQEKRKPIELNTSTPPNDCVSVPTDHNDWGFFCDLFRRWWLSQEAFGDNPLQRQDALRRGGYEIVTSIDPDVQETMQGHVVSKEPTGSPFAHGAVAIEPGTGLVKGMAVNRNFALNAAEDATVDDIAGNYPDTVAPLLGGGELAGYQAGSTFKWFVLLAALDAGLPMDTRISSPHQYVSSYPSGGPASCGGYWCPRNASPEMAGNHGMWSGFGQSVNTYFVQLQELVGAGAAVRMAENLGLTWRTEVDQTHASPDRADGWGPFTLGVSDANPLEMANAYAVAAADGNYCEPLPVVSIKDRDGHEVTYTDEHGNQVPVSEPRCRQAVTPEVARAATDIALCPTGSGAATGSCGGWATAEPVSDIVGRPVAGKTGTTDDNRTAWMVGYTPELAVAAFTADPDNPMNAAGGGRASQSILTVSETLRDALRGEPVTDFEPPPRSIIR